MRHRLVASILLFGSLLAFSGFGHAAWTPDPAGPTGIQVNATATYQGGLWVATRGGIARFDSAGWKMVYHPKAFEVIQMQVHGGLLYLLTWYDLWAYDGTSMRQVSPSSLSDYLWAFDVDVTTGKVYLATATEVLRLDTATSVTHIPFGGGEIDQYGLAVHGGKIVVRDSEGALHTSTGGSWTKVTSTLDFSIYTFMYYGPRGLFVANSAKKMPIDLSTGAPTSGAHGCYLFADVQWSDAKDVVFIGGRNATGSEPAIVDRDGNWTTVLDPGVASTAFLTSDGSVHTLGYDDFVLRSGGGGGPQEIGSGAPLPHFFELVAKGDHAVAAGAKTLWFRQDGGPWRPIQKNYTGYHVLPGDQGDFWALGSGTKNLLHVLADGRVEGEGYDYVDGISIPGSKPIAFALGNLFTANEKGLYRRTGSQQWQKVADFTGQVDYVYNYVQDDAPPVYISPITGETTIGFLVLDPSGQRQILYIVVDGARWGFLPKPAGYSYVRSPVIWQGKTYAFFYNTSPAKFAFFLWDERNWRWQEQTTSGLPSGDYVGDLTSTPSGIVAFVWSTADPAHVATYQYSGDGWNVIDEQGVAWGPLFATYFEGREMLMSGGWGAGPLLRTAPGGLAADFSWQSAAPVTGEAVQFTDTSVGPVGSWQWTFGDGGTSSSQNPSHVYASTGTYTVRLAVTGSGRSSSASSTIRVTAPVAPLVAAFSWAPTMATAGQTVQFSDASTGEPVSWSWSFGDGKTSTQRNPSTSYAAAGTYTVTLTVSNPSGSATKSSAITVQGAPGADEVLLLSRSRMKVWVSYRSQYGGGAGPGKSLPRKDEFGFFYFSDANNPEVFVKVLDFGAERPFLLFAAGLTDFEYTVNFQNVRTGKVVTWTKPAGAFDGFANATDLPQGPNEGNPGTASLESYGLSFDAMVAAAREQLTAASEELILSKGRIKVSVTWRNQYGSGSTGTGKALPQKDEFGFFYFSDENNPEVFVKALDFGVDRAFLVFFAGLTDFEYTVNFTNLCTGQTWSQLKPAYATNGGANTAALVQNGCVSGP